MRTEVLTYVPSDVILLLSGYEITGWEAISIARSSPAFRQIKGIRGKNTRVQLPDSSAVITISALQTELLHEVLSKILEADIAEGTARLEISLSEISGGTRFSTINAYISGYPEIGYGKDNNTVVWTLLCENSDLTVGSAVNSNVEAVQNFLTNVNNLLT